MGGTERVVVKSGDCATFFLNLIDDKLLVLEDNSGEELIFPFFLVSSGRTLDFTRFLKDGLRGDFWVEDLKGSEEMSFSIEKLERT